ncbi:sigma-70 family RNA polymerase sigma factor [Streptomyces sp. HNM0663]|uniref:Sigma-70 family RNA polymerase sigma factor n=1 Tax=Streptomyces chengmaiensis TaxID=3040919 RepID=A0ABT6HKI9_9ACTN|nr:sigma-70 family RNA polymerase sigma factor [Streptomyces chengmaiensis]MDH2389250.1 sigma-70 family RNA polymerase sigma factor [Streptomyces chengmaiensis]
METAPDIAIEELYRLHRPAVLSYARSCCRDAHTAEDLVSEAFARTLQAVRSGRGPEAAWRPYLLAVVRRVAAEWAATDRRTQLSADFGQWLDHLPGIAGEESAEERILRLEDSSLVLRAFRSLPERWQTALWHTVVEEESASTVGALLGLGPSGVGSLAARAREGLREAYLAAHAERASASEECRRYSSLLGAAVRRAGRRPNRDLDRHLEHCAPCRGALSELIELNERLDAKLPAGVLLFGSSGYIAARAAETGAGAAGAASALGRPGDSVLPDGVARAWQTRATGSPAQLGAVAGGIVAVIGVTVFLLPSPFDDGRNAAGPWKAAVEAPRTFSPYPPPVRLDAAEPKDSPSPRPLSRTPSPTSAPSPATPPPAPRTTESKVPGTIIWSGPLRSLGVGTQCVEPAAASVVQRACDGGEEQLWQAVSFHGAKNHRLLRNAATGQCVDYTAGVRKIVNNAAFFPVRMAPCRENGEGQKFSLDAALAEGEISYLLRTERDVSKPWFNMQLGMFNWCPTCPGYDPELKQAEPLTLTHNYYHAPRLRYLLDGMKIRPDQPVYVLAGPSASESAG